ncbi:U-box domain-containing protein 44-like [Cornus florida]|uniref:U-box domain-containing protein 44-like n=1 Tax=Cornus florida TaxID=4283 RepID=UPI002896C9DF|nr:U-box domain-containing protein 44-like [Cornus florida]XP_059651957.1 U-box domain-containing protein 44-like [Cornus florida]
MDTKTFSELISEILTSADEVASMAKGSEVESETITEFSVFVEKLTPILSELKDKKVLDTPPIRKAVESFETDLRRAKALISSPNCSSPAKQIEDVTHDLGRSLGLVLFASHDVTVDGKEKIETLRREMMNARFDSSSDRESEFVNDVETEEDSGDEIVEERISLDVDDVVLQLKYGNDEEFKCALLGLNALIRDQMITDEWTNDEGIIPVLFNRLGSSKPNNRLTIIRILRSLAAENTENKEKMADVGCLSTLVKSLTRDVEEQKEAVGLLLSLSDLSAVRRRIGRIQGCIVMLVTIFNGDDPVGSNDAGMLLNALSSNTQNALHMAEAGYFKPLVQYLREGSDMSKILMATALSRMELTDQSSDSLGENGAIEPLVKMFNAGKLEAKLSALSALQNLSSLKENIQRLINSGIVVALLQLLFSVTSVLMTLREPASAILARIAQSESILVNQDVAQQMLSLLNLSSPIIQYHLLQALNGIVSHSSASKVRRKMKENGAIQLLLPFLAETYSKTRIGALNLIYTLTKDLPGDITEQLGETHLNTIVNIISSSMTEIEKAAAIGILSNLPVSDKKATETLKKAHLLPILISIMNSCPATSTPTTCWLNESIAGVLIRFTVPTDKKLQQFSAEHGVIPLLVKLLSIGSPVAKCRAAASLAQLSQNSLSLRKSRTSRWMCVPPSVEAFCEVHDGYCFVKNTFCLVKAGAVSPLVQILEGNEREADEAILDALGTLLQDEICENGTNYIAKMSGVEAIVKVLESGTVKAQDKALWVLERIFRVESHRVQYGVSAQVVLVDLAQSGDPKLKPKTAKLLAQLELLQTQSSYF